MQSTHLALFALLEQRIVHLAAAELWIRTMVSLRH